MLFGTKILLRKFFPTRKELVCHHFLVVPRLGIHQKVIEQDEEEEEKHEEKGMRTNVDPQSFETSLCLKNSRSK